MKQRAYNMMNPSFSIKIPYWKIVHFRAGKKVGESRPACFKGLAHYDRRNRPIGTSVRNFIGEPNHYNSAGNCVGYSRRDGLGRIDHYDQRGNYLGRSVVLLWLFVIHSSLPLFSGVDRKRSNIPRCRQNL